MFNPSKKQIMFVYAVAAVLALLFILSITVFSPVKNKKRTQQQLRFLHEADISNIDLITIQNGTDVIILSRTDNMWLVVNQNDINDKLPADTQRLQKLFVLLASKHTMTKAGKAKTSENNAYGLDEQNATVMTIYKNGQAYQSLVFGDLNFSQTERYFTTNELNSVLLAGEEFDAYLSTSVQSWTDPYIISSQLKNEVFNMGEPQGQNYTKLFELRHGGFAEKGESHKVLAFIIQMGDKSTIELEISQLAGDEDAAKNYIVKTTFDSPRLSKSFSYNTQISEWTYNKISEIML